MKDNYGVGREGEGIIGRGKRNVRKCVAEE